VELHIISPPLLERPLLLQVVRVQKLNDDGKVHCCCRWEADFRALALKALDQRLHAANINKSTTPAPAVAPMVASINTSAEDTGPKENETKAEGS